MTNEIDKKTNAILKVISESQKPIGSAEISDRLKEMGMDMPERTVRYHLKSLNEKGLIKVLWKEGRMITSKGKEELSNALVFDKVGLMSARIETMAYKMDFDLYKKSGKVILNLSLFHKSDYQKALKLMKDVFKKGFTTGELVFVGEAGQMIGEAKVPAGKVAFGTLCSINFDGILLKHAIPVEAKFGGLLQIENLQPLRFTEMIGYSGSTLDPHEVFLKSRMTSVREAANGSGKILAGLREIPAASRDEAEAIIRKAQSAGFGKALIIGRPGQAVMGMPVGLDRVGIVFPGGLNPVAAAEEWGIRTESKALVAMVEYDQLVNFWDLV
jgi:hypothetical protein